MKREGEKTREEDEIKKRIRKHEEQEEETGGKRNK